jgi:hypothetical protein
VSTSDPPINLDGKVKLGTRSLAGIAIALYILAGGVWRLPTKDDYDTHNLSPESHPPLRAAVGVVATEVAAVKSHMEMLERGQRDTHQDIEYVRSRVDFLTEEAVRRSAETQASKTEPRRATAVGNAAVEQLRRGAPPEAAVEGSLEDL